MATKLHPLTEQVQDLLLDSGSHPRTVSLLLDSLDDYFKSQCLLESKSFAQTLRALYSIDDNQMYSIIASFDDDYSFYLFPSLQTMIGQVSKTVIKDIKAEQGYEGETLHREIRNLTDSLKNILALLKDSIRSSRRAIGYESTEPDLPSFEVMKVFYECGRKTSYRSEEEATSKIHDGNAVYLCEHCNTYHQGRPRTATKIPEGVMRGRYRLVWRRYHEPRKPSQNT